MKDDGPDTSLGYALWHAALAWRAEVQRALDPHGLTPTQFFALGAVGWLGVRGESPTQREVAAHAGLDPMTTSQVLRALAKRGLVIRRADPSDARTRRVVATEAGRAVIRGAAAAVRAVDRDLAGAIPDPDGLRAALDILKQRRER